MLRVIALGPDSSFNAFLLRTNFPVFRIDRSPRLVVACCRTDDARVAATIYHRHTERSRGSRNRAARGYEGRQRRLEYDFLRIYFEVAVEAAGYGVEEKQPQQWLQRAFCKRLRGARYMASTYRRHVSCTRGTGWSCSKVDEIYDAK